MKEAVLSGIKGWRGRMARRLKRGCLYRSAARTLVSRCKKKLTAKTSWYGQRRKIGDDLDGKKVKKVSRKVRNEKEKERRTEPMKIEITEMSNSGSNTVRKSIIAVMFVPFPPESELAKRLRKAEENRENLTG